MKLRSITAFLSAFLCLVGSVLAQGNRDPGPPDVLKDQEQYVSFWTTEANWHSVLQLRNNSPARDLIITPSLRAIDGTETALSPVTVKTHEVVSINLHEAVMAAATRPTSSYGSVVLRYKAVATQVLYAALMVHRDARPIAFHIDAMGQLENDADYLREGVWWLPNEKVNDYLILTNQGDRTMPMNLSLYDASGKTYTKALSLSGRAVMRLSVRQLLGEGNLSGSYGGIQVHALAHARALDTLHVIYDEDAGFSALLKMFDHDPAANLFQRDFGKKGVWTIHAPMLALAHPDPALFIPAGTVLEPKIFFRNTTSQPESASMVFYWRSASKTGTSAGPTVSLKPHETREVKVADLPEDQAPPKDAYWASVAISTSSKPDEIVAVAASYDATLKYGAQTPFSDQLSYIWEGGEWLADASHNSLITVGNASLKPMKARFTLFYNQGAEHYELEQPLEPNEQMWVDVGDLIRSGRPDIHGSVLPKNLTSGSYQFRDLTNPGVGSLFEGKVIYDLTNGHVTYGCAACCSPRNIFMTFNPFLVGLAASVYDSVSEQDGCGDPVENISGAFSGWATANTAIATTTTAGDHTGRAMGSTTSNATGVVIHTNGRNGCFQEPWPIQGPTQVTPTVSISGASTITAGAVTNTNAAKQYTLTATANPGGGTFSWTSSSSSVNITSGATSATVSIVGVSSGTSTLTVSYVYNAQTAVTAKQAVTSLKADNILVTEDDVFSQSNGCPAGTYGNGRLVTYSIHSGANIINDGIMARENVPPFNDSCGKPVATGYAGFNTLAYTPSGAAAGTGFTDNIGICPASTTQSCTATFTSQWQQKNADGTYSSIGTVGTVVENSATGATVAGVGPNGNLVGRDFY